MKLLVISTDRALFDKDAPVRSRLLEQAELVDKTEVIVFTPRGEKFCRTELSPKLTVIPTSSLGKWTYLPDAFRLGSEALSGDPAGEWLVTAQDPFEAGAIAYLLTKKFGIPLHLQLHTDPFSREWQKERTMNRLRFALALHLLKSANGIRVVSHRVEQALTARGISKEKITVVPIFTDTKKFAGGKPAFDLKRSHPQFGHIILSMGRLAREKNFTGLIRSFAAVRKSVDDALLLIAGDGPEKEHLQFLARSFGIEKAVKIIPWVRDTVSYYKGCDVYVQPSLYEGWGLAVVEASASGTPVVMTEVGCAGEVIKDGESGLIVAPDDDQALGEAIVWMLKNPAKAKQLAISAQKFSMSLAPKSDTLKWYKSSWEKAARMGTNKDKR